jgi:glycosyltransferase involved in cell wall biosynthesis
MMADETQLKKASAGCPICDESRRDYLFVVHGMRLSRCRGCGFVSAEVPRGRPGTDALEPQIASPTVPLDKSAEQSAAGNYLRDLRLLRPAGARLLLVATPGHPASIEASLAGFTVVTHVSAADWEAGASLGTGHDAALVIQQLETTARPQDLLEAIRQALSADGHLMVIALSLDSFAVKFFKSLWIGWQLHNRSFFTRKTLRLLLLKSGFGETWLAPDRRKYSVDHISERLTRSPSAIVSRLARGLHAVLPGSLRKCCIPVVTSGLIATAQRVALRSRPLVSIVVPVYNEKATFCQLMDGLLARRLAGADREIIVVESNSKDGTREAVLGYQSHPEVRVLLQERPRGKGNAVREGFAAAHGDILMIQDADLEYDLDDYEMLLEPLLNWRELFVLGARHGGSWKMRRFAGQQGIAAALNFGHVVFTTLINVLYRQRMRDPFTMYKVLRSDCLYGLQFECNAFDFDHELVIKLVLKGYTPLEIPVNYSSRSYREGKKVNLFREPIRWLKVDFRNSLLQLAPPYKRRQNADNRSQP